MRTRFLHFASLPAALTLLALAGCPTTHTAPPDADADASVDTSTSVVMGTQPLASACLANSDCSTGRCVEGVCCDSACEQTCLSCVLAGAVGHCGPIAQGPDPVASAPCTGTQGCFLNFATSISSCKTVDGAACDSDTDCGSAHCLTYYLDADGDGYGGAESAKFCGEVNAAPPAGYAAYTGDCCDLDNVANPGFSSSTYLEFPDACGSFDWNCNGVVAPQHTSCGAAGPPACGAPCAISFGFGTFTSYTEACN